MEVTTKQLIIPVDYAHSETERITASARNWSGAIMVFTEVTPNCKSLIIQIPDRNDDVAKLKVEVQYREGRKGVNYETFSTRECPRLKIPMKKLEDYVYPTGYRKLIVEITVKLNHGSLGAEDPDLKSFLVGNFPPELPAPPVVPPTPPTVSELLEAELYTVKYQTLRSKYSGAALSRFEGEPFTKQPGADIAIRAEDKDFFVHEDVLSQSNVMVTMLQAPMVERDTRVIVIEDFGADDVKAFLRVLYNVRAISNYADDTSALLSIYRLADKYALPDIQDLVAVALPRIAISEETICDVLAFAVTYEKQDLVKRCIDVSKAFPTSFWSRPDFMQFIAENPAVAAQFMSAMIQRISV